MDSTPTTPDIAILTHHKCASNWLRAICHGLSRANLITLSVSGGQKQEMKDASGDATKTVLLNVNATSGSTAAIDLDLQPNIHFVRDPRDAFVSNYWSWLNSHSNNTDDILDFRKRAQNMPVEEGMLELIQKFPMGKQLETWSDELWDKTRLVKYENMLQDFGAALDSMFTPCGLKISPEVSKEIEASTSFKKITGRDAGDENLQHHFRKGISGDWKNYFTGELQDAFLERYGWMGKRLNYW